jgi:hypothetical protein
MTAVICCCRLLFGVAVNCEWDAICSHSFTWGVLGVFQHGSGVGDLQTLICFC